MEKIMWLEGLKQGDYVIVFDAVNGEREIKRVTGTSKKNIYVGEESFSKFKQYCNLGTNRLIQPTIEEIEIFEKEQSKLQQDLKNYSFENLTKEQMILLHTYLNKFEKEKNNLTVL